MNRPISKTSSAGGVVINSNGDVLVVNQRGTTWSLPKGHVEEGEDLLNAALREILEETGLRDLRYIRTLGTYKRLKEFSIRFDGSELKTITMFLFFSADDNLQPQDTDNPEAVWVNKESVIDILTYKEDKEFFLRIVDLL